MGSLISSISDPLDLFGQQAAQQAADIQTGATREGTAELKRQFDLQQERLDPFFEQAAPAVDLLSKFSGAQGRGEQAKAFEVFEESAGQRFLRSRGSDAVQQTLDRLGTGDDRVKQALAEEGRQISAQDFQNQLNRLATVGGIAQTTGSQLGQSGQQFATQFGQLRQAEADAITQGSRNQQAGRQNLANQAFKAFGAFGGGS